MLAYGLCSNWPTFSFSNQKFTHFTAFMKIHLVCYEDPEAWICGKIARRLAENLCKLGHSCVIGGAPDDTADINHHVIYINYPGCTNGVHSLMVTHIDDALKLGKLRRGLLTARAAICMSAESVRRLSGLGLNPGRLTFVSPAHDGVAPPRRIVVGITTRLYPDGRKRERDLVRLAERLSPEDFSFKIMGFGWADIVKGLRAQGFIIEYFEEFDLGKYQELISSLDYFLYLSGDEGSMGYVDALAAGVKTIVQPQGFHLDAVGGITHAFSSFEELRMVFKEIIADKHKRQNAVRNWTWENYAQRHIDIWERCLAGRPLQEGAGMSAPASATRRLAGKSRLWTNVFMGRVRTFLNMGNDFDCDSRLWQKRRARKRPAK